MMIWPTRFHLVVLLCKATDPEKWAMEKEVLVANASSAMEAVTVAQAALKGASLSLDDEAVWIVASTDLRSVRLLPVKYRLRYPFPFIVEAER